MAGLVFFLKLPCLLKVQEFFVTLVLKSRHFCKLRNVMPNFKRNEKNRQLMNKFSLSILLIFIINISYGQECQIPNLLDKEIIEASNNEKFVEEDFYRINNLLFEYQAKDSLKNLNKCSSYF